MALGCVRTCVRFQNGFVVVMSRDMCPLIRIVGYVVFTQPGHCYRGMRGPYDYYASRRSFPSFYPYRTPYRCGVSKWWS